MKRRNFRSYRVRDRATKKLKVGWQKSLVLDYGKAQHSAIRKSTTNTLRYVLKVVLGGI